MNENGSLNIFCAIFHAEYEWVANLYNYYLQMSPHFFIFMGFMHRDRWLRASKTKNIVLAYGAPTLMLVNW